MKIGIWILAVIRRLLLFMDSPVVTSYHVFGIPYSLGIVNSSIMQAYLEEWIEAGAPIVDDKTAQNTKRNKDFFCLPKLSNAEFTQIDKLLHGTNTVQYLYLRSY
jgi:hypothetical protein